MRLASPAESRNEYFDPTANASAIQQEHHASADGRPRLVRVDTTNAITIVVAADGSSCGLFVRIMKDSNGQPSTSASARSVSMDARATSANAIVATMAPAA